MGRSAFKGVRGLALAAVMLTLGLAAARLGRPSLQAQALGDFFVLDRWAEQVLGLQLPDRALTMRGPGGDVALGATALSARFLPSGEVVYINDDLALWRLNPATGAATELQPPASANAPLFVSPDGSQLAYLKPRDVTTREAVAVPLSNGIAVYDLAAGAERVLLEVPEVTVNLYGWAGDRLLVQIPTWDPATLAPPAVVQVAALPITDPPQLPVPLAELPALSPGARYPQTSLDQRYLAYETEAGVVVASLDPGTVAYAVFDNVTDPHWTEHGLTVADESGRKSLDWSPGQVSKSAPALGPLAWPPAALETEAPATGAEANAVLFYRPVSASTRVSAYMDLDTNPNAIRDWMGWVGDRWRYGRAYDGHWGTDYDGVTGNPVNAAQSGVVNRVVIYPYNTYPNGPASFGTYVRLYHGQLSDALHYWTLVGHLLPDGVALGEGQWVTGLPTRLGWMGNTGWSTGDHTHLQVYRKQDGNFTGSYSIDPYSWGIISDQPITLPPPTPTPIPPTHGTVSGVVRDAQNQPVAGASIKLIVNGRIHLATSGPGGAYSFSEVLPGAATLTAVKGARWGSAAGTVQVGQVLGGDVSLSQCASQATAVEGCPALAHDQAQFVADLSLDDGTVVSPGQVVQKRWRLRNTGTTAWGAGYQLVFVSGNREGATPAAVNVPATAINATTDLGVTMTAASATGLHRGYWRLRNAQGVYFGPTIWVELNTQPGGQALSAAVPGWDDTEERSGLPAAPQSTSAAACTVSAPANSTAGTFTVSWSASGGQAIVSYDVQFRDSSRGPWRDWVRAYPAAQTSAAFTGQVGHAYGFRCRATDAQPSTGTYPAEADAVTLVGGLAGQPDLTITNLQARPAPGGGLLATATIHNAGSAATQRGFVVDLYRNDPPNSVTDFAGIAYSWVSESLAAGATVTLNFALTDPAGQADLTAQVDTGNLIPESNEGNNAYTSAASGCVQAVDGYEYDDVPAAAKPLAAGSSQNRNFGGPSAQDWIALSLTPGRLYRVETSGLGAGVDTRLAVYNAAGTALLGFNDDRSATSLASELLFAPRGTVTSYLLRVDNWNPATGGCGAAYTVSLADVGAAYLQWLPLSYR